MAVVRELLQVANLGARELRRRLKTDPDSIQTRRDLTVLTGVAIDKVAKWERWGDEDDEDEGRRSWQFALLMERADSGGSHTGRCRASDPRTIDVTPIEAGSRD